MILDDRGRLFGRINLLDLTALCFLLILGSSVGYVLRVSHRQTLQIFSVEPKRIVAGSGTRAVMKGTGFDNRTTARLGDYNDQSGVYIDESTIGIEITEQYDPGIYRIIVHDERGRYIALPDAVEVVWVPQITEVKLKTIYNTGEGAWLEVFGAYFSDRASVFVGDRRLEVVGTTGHKQIQAKLKKGDAPLPLGEYPVTIVNKEGQSVTLKRGVTVLPPPEVHSIEPDTLRLGETADLFLHGSHFRKGTRIWFNEREMGEARYVSPECLRIEVTGSAEINREPLFLQIPDGPKIEMMDRPLKIRSASPVLVVVTILPDEKGRAGLESLRQRPEWQGRRGVRKLTLTRAQRKLKQFPVVEVVVPARLFGGHGVYRYEYGGQQLRVGKFIRVVVNGQKISGTVVKKPYALFVDDASSAKNSKR